MYCFRLSVALRTSAAVRGLNSSAAFEHVHAKARARAASATSARTVGAQWVGGQSGVAAATVLRLHAPIVEPSAVHGSGARVHSVSTAAV
jgi:hypothetical protein